MRLLRYLAYSCLLACALFTALFGFTAIYFLLSGSTIIEIDVNRFGEAWIEAPLLVAISAVAIYAWVKALDRVARDG